MCIYIYTHSGQFASKTLFYPMIIGNDLLGSCCEFLMRVAHESEEYTTNVTPSALLKLIFLLYFMRKVFTEFSSLLTTLPGKLSPLGG